MTPRKVSRWEWETEILNCPSIGQPVIGVGPVYANFSDWDTGRDIRMGRLFALGIGYHLTAREPAATRHKRAREAVETALKVLRDAAAGQAEDGWLYRARLSNGTSADEHWLTVPANEMPD